MERIVKWVLKKIILILGFLLVALVFIAAQQSAHAQTEPIYCNLEVIKKLEVAVPDKRLERAHAFLLDGAIVTGLAIGDSDTEAVKAYANSSANKYCTFYFNNDNTAAEQAFNWHYVPNPMYAFAKPWTNYPKKFDNEIGPILPSMDACAKAGKLSMGCQGQRHRGPSVFGMYLTYKGCTPEHALEIVNHFWGKNGVSKATRLAIIKTAVKHRK